VYSVLKHCFPTFLGPQIRIKAQLALSSCLDIYLYSGRKLLPDIWPLLSNSNDVSHEQFKGALHLLMLSPVISVFLHDWELMRHTLPALVKADHSEKPTIHNLMNKLLQNIVTKYDSFTIQFQVRLNLV
jgi:proteasome activator subunit 4